MIETTNNRRTSIILGSIAVLQLLLAWFGVSQIRDLVIGLGAEMPLVIRAGLALFRYPVLGIAAIPLFVVLVARARPSTTFGAFVVSWILGALGCATVAWSLQLLNHITA